MYTFSRILIRGPNIYAVARVWKQTKRGLSLSQNDQFLDVLMLKENDRLFCLPPILTIITACFQGYVSQYLITIGYSIITLDRYFIDKVKTPFWLIWHKGYSGMIASSSTFRPHTGRVIRDLFRLLDAVYGIVRKH